MTQIQTLLLPVLLLLLGSCGEKDEKNKPATPPATETGRFDSEARHEEVVPIVSKQIDLEVQEIKSKDATDVKDALDNCGISNIDADQPTFVTDMSYPYENVINAGIAKAFVPITSKLDLDGFVGRVTLDVGVEVGTVSGTSELGPVTDVKSIEQRAAEISGRFKGPVTNYLYPVNSHFAGIFREVRCTIIPGQRLENRRGGYATDVSFSKGYAPNLSPIATRERYETELQDSRVQTGIVATVTATNNPLLVVGKEYVGNSIIEKIPPVKETHIGTIEGDLAYRITNHFGTDEITLALGFHLWTEYYVDVKNHTFSAVIADVGDEEIMHFVGTYEGDGLPKVWPRED